MFFYLLEYKQTGSPNGFPGSQCPLLKLSIFRILKSQILFSAEDPGLLFDVRSQPLIKHNYLPSVFLNLGELKGDFP